MIVMLETDPPESVAVAVAPVPVVSPDAGVIVTTGASVYEWPPAVTAMVLTIIGSVCATPFL